MKIYRVYAERAVQYYIAVKDGENPDSVANNHVDEAYDWEHVDTSVTVEDFQAIDPFDKILDEEEIYNSDGSIIHDIREQILEEQEGQEEKIKPAPNQGYLF